MYIQIIILPSPHTHINILSSIDPARTPPAESEKRRREIGDVPINKYNRRTRTTNWQHMYCFTWVIITIMSAARRKEERRGGITLAVVTRLLILLLCMAATTEGEWVMDYASGMGRCCSVIPVEACEPESAAANRACMDVCHYGGCRKGGQCEYVGAGIAVSALGFGARACRCYC